MDKVIKNIIFDIHGVLQPKSSFPNKEFADAVAKVISKRLNIGFEDAKKFYAENRPKFDSTSLLMWDIGAYREYLDSFLTVPFNAQKRPEVTSLIGELRKKYDLYVATNSPRKYAMEILKELGIDTKIFKKIVTAEDVGRPRPYPDQFEAIVSGNKEEYVFLGDRMESDIIPAREFGMKAILVDENLPDILKQFLGN